MSLFDRDDDSVVSESSSSSIHSPNHALVDDVSSKNTLESTLPLHVPPLFPTNEPLRISSNATRGQFTLTESEILSAQQDQKRLLERRLGSRMGIRGGLNATFNQPSNNLASSASLGINGKTGRSDSSVFGNSIAAALRLRKEEQEELLLRKLCAERSNDPSLIEKDLEVGVFVTSAYKKMLRHHQKRCSGLDDATDKVSSEPTDSAEKGEDNDDDLLESYIRSLERNLPKIRAISETDPPRLSCNNVTNGLSCTSKRKASELGSHYDQVMLMRLHEDAQASGRTQEQQPPQGHSIEDVINRPSLSELKTLVLTEGAVTHTEDAILTDGKEMSIPDAMNKSVPCSGGNTDRPPDAGRGVKSQNEALIEHKRTLFLAREARKRRRVDAAFIYGCAQRCEERMIKLLHLV
ncbi:unnamed protein product [Phytomonas sp. Hart1]|nr:unnamed protein product [Phytomonas sp. Hart1]|eukprot:CCW66180.1 unnamed protein product [Phytomonas sp. isolate Hart1]